ncbi:MAG TPA: DNA polymerase domain-containing protein [Methanocella sp.]|uniref:DNA polymerase domain-containing protein n=1 Tax=Methanocella sp. TaxID=2052833 RepID=UPI002D020490|nr:DNA polymerase domain-containing protein [Methanocella sp.]HTY89799.1 DNA polymerase domain-containing protein [Methanocella sp.]
MQGILVDTWHRPSADGRPGAYLLWIRTEGGIVCLEDRDFRPSFAVIPERNAALVESAVAQHENVSRIETSPRYQSIYAAEQVPVIRAFLLDERKAEETMREIRQRSPANVSFAEAKLLPGLQWHYLRGVPPHSIVDFEAREGILKAISAAGPCDTSKLRVLAVNCTFGPADPAKCRLISISLFDGTAETVLKGAEAVMIKALQEALDERDPDVVALFDADNMQLPLLGLRARANGLTLRFGRVPWSTGLHASNARITHWQAAQVRAPGRVILDLWKDARTDADLKRTDLTLDSVYDKEFSGHAEKSEAARVYELAVERLPMFTSWCQRCMMPLDSVCREKHGFMNASMVNAALIGTTVIPDTAEYPEGFKTPLVESVKENGGLVITPVAGLHEDVAILDFASLFPRIFVKHNISPETINCRHEYCREHGEKVPFLGFHICARRRGVYPEVFGRVLEERDRVKRAMSELDPASAEYRKLDVLSRSLKMQLVSPYGYMQFALNNFRTVDGNRSVPAFGRYYLLKARDMAEEAGFSVIYADTDSLFLHRNSPARDYRAFSERITKELGMELKLEHVCRWVLFLPERPGCSKGLKKKYFASVDGEPLVRGLEVRRQDRARIAKDTQETVLEMLAAAHDKKEFAEAVPAAVAYVRGQVARLVGGHVRADDLAIIKKLSRRPEEYKAMPHHCVAAEKLAGSGRRVRVGGKIEYVVTGKNRAVPLEMAREAPLAYDVDAYVDNVVRPVYMLLREFGVRYEDLLPGKKQARLDRFVQGCRA